MSRRRRISFCVALIILISFSFAFSGEYDIKGKVNLKKFVHTYI